MAWALQCCGCGRLMTPAGATLPLSGGLLDLIPVSETETAGGFADFPTREAADVAAKQFGWSVADPDGAPNHRCPSCQSLPASPRRGAYVRTGGGDVGL